MFINQARTRQWPPDWASSSLRAGVASDLSVCSQQTVEADDCSARQRWQKRPIQDATQHAACLGPESPCAECDDNSDGVCKVDDGCPRQRPLWKMSLHCPSG